MVYFENIYINYFNVYLAFDIQYLYIYIDQKKNKTIFQQLHV